MLQTALIATLLWLAEAIIELTIAGVRALIGSRRKALRCRRRWRLTGPGTHGVGPNQYHSAPISDVCGCAVVGVAGLVPAAQAAGTSDTDQPPQPRLSCRSP